MNISVDNMNTLKLSQAGHNFLIKGMDSCDEMNEYCFVYVAKGVQNFRIPEIGDIPVPAGSFMIYPPGTQYRSYTSDDVGENYWIIFTGFEHEIFKLLNFEPYKIYKSEPSSHINEYFEKISEELLFETSHHNIMVQTIFIELLINLWRRCHNTVIYEDDIPQKSKTHSISLAVYMMKSQCQKNYTLEEYAKMCNLSSYRFCHKFKEEMGMSPMIYRKLCRLKKTQVLMRKYPSWSISKIAEHVGFESASYFCSAFKEYFNVTPSDYKKEFKKSS